MNLTKYSLMIKNVKTSQMILKRLILKFNLPKTKSNKLKLFICHFYSTASLLFTIKFVFTDI